MKTSRRNSALHRADRNKVERKTLSTIDFESAKADMGCKNDKIIQR